MGTSIPPSAHPTPAPSGDVAVDVVVVSYNSRDQLRNCVGPLAADGRLNVIVVDNASPDRAHETIADLPVTVIESGRNGGFSSGCNIGWRAGAAPSVLFLNPDARITPDAVVALAAIRARRGLGAVGPLIRDGDGGLDPSQRRFPSASSTWARALFLHRLLPAAPWTDEMERRPERYAVAGTPDWISGACMLVPREVLERIGGFDERFFLYSEDADICRRIRDLGLEVGFDPAVECGHDGGASAPRAGLAPVLVESRLLYSRGHDGPLGRVLMRVGLGVEELIRAALGAGGEGGRRGHLAALGRVVRGARPRGEPPGGRRPRGRRPTGI